MDSRQRAEAAISEARDAVAAWTNDDVEQSDAEAASSFADHIEALSVLLEAAVSREAKADDKQDGMLRHGDANAVGELLREQTFTGEGLGCYYNFEVRNDARAWDESERQQFFCEIGYIDPSDDDQWNDWKEVVAGSQGYSFDFAPYQIEVAWYWDGDGVLCFRVWRDGELLRSLINYDCKKPYRWEENRPLHFDKQLAPARA